MIRARFKANLEDSRPVKWPVKYPFWESGVSDEHAIVISYADNVEYIYENWPEATELSIENVDEIKFTDRFKKPDWYRKGE